MRINNLVMKGVEIKVISKRVKHGFAGSRQIALYEASCMVKNKVKTKRSENIGELVEWVKKNCPKDQMLIA